MTDKTLYSKHLYIFMLIPLNSVYATIHKTLCVYMCRKFYKYDTFAFVCVKSEVLRIFSIFRDAKKWY